MSALKPYVHRVRQASLGGSSEAVLGVYHGAPQFEVPAGACDCHVHIFGPRDRYPLAEDRTFAPGLAGVDDIVAVHRRLGIERLVIVQASVQGTDNRCIVDALAQLHARGRQARAVAVVPAHCRTAELDALHAAGVRGLRVNLQSHGVTDAAAARRRMQAAAAVAAAMGWHVQAYTALPVIAALADTIAALPVPLVLDHFGLADPAPGPAQPGLAALLELVRSGCVYVKLSAPYRIVHRPDGADGEPLARAFIEAGPDRMLWGTDWPHTGPWPGKPRERNGVEPFHPVDDGVQLDLFARWTTPEERLRILVDNPARLYGF
jgi:predicted TIM-barrel fold metal-dependent hydrolase